MTKPSTTPGELRDWIEWIHGKSIADLKAIEVGGRVLIPETIHRAKADGTFEPVPVMMRVPRETEMAKARADAVGWASKLKLNRDADPERFDALDTICIVARSLRDVKPPHDQFQTYEQLDDAFDRVAIAELLDRLSIYERMFDRRLPELDEKTFWTAVGGIARTGRNGPLVAFAGPTLDAFITRMAVELWSYRTPKSSSGSKESSTSEPSATTN